MVGSDYSATMSQIIYKIVPEALWREAERNGRFTGAPVDVADGFIHFSTAGQARETAAKHFAGQTGLLLAAIDGAKLGDALKYEVSRGGALFPHLYGPLDLEAVVWVHPLPLGTDGLHQFPALEAE
ncbi:MAG: DUF952 domain-containing protein [Mesorhizobium sp.]|nr:MAG: DUF952 domain-containing protein [Mesorhizobium sp.]TIO31630.1 MAG: DUF952 domain-containing protein [Mesorhizobium sp.]TIP09821.1 MAG: DUF952 domain-containing protein [Mesorhizobium sp.]